MIAYVTGTLGAGKSMYAARKAGQALLSGKVVATNMRFRDGWERTVLRRAPHYIVAGRRRRREYEAEIRSRYAYVPEIWVLLSARVRGRGEGRGVMIIDEAHNELNNREWAEDNQKTALRKLTLARKRGWEVYLISQHRDNTDAAARRIATVEIKLINWRQFTRVPLLGTPLLPFHLFLAQAFPANQPANVVSAKKVMYRELFRVGWYSRLYDTFEDFDGGLSDEDEDALWLPLRSPHAAPAPVAPASLRAGSGAAPELLSGESTS